MPPQRFHFHVECTAFTCVKYTNVWWKLAIDWMRGDSCLVRSSPDRVVLVWVLAGGHCAVFLGKTLYSHCSLPTQEYKWALENFMLMIQASHSRWEFKIFLVASCYRNRDQLRPDRLLNWLLCIDFTLPYAISDISLWSYLQQEVMASFMISHVWFKERIRQPYLIDKGSCGFNGRYLKIFSEC